MGLLLTAALWGGILLVALIVLITVLRGIKMAKPNEAIIVTSKQRTNRDGDETGGQRVVFGSRVFVKPLVEAYSRLSLSSRQLDVTANVQTKDAVGISVKAVAVVKVGGTEADVRAAAQRFLDQQDQIERSTEEVLIGSVRAIVGQLTVQEIITNRTTLQANVFQEVKEALGIQGLTVDTLQVKEISDASSYIVNLGRAEAARVRQIAEIAEAQANQASEEARIRSEQAVADQQRELDLRKAAIQKETDKAKAEADQAKPLADAIAQQEVITQQEITAQRRVALKKQELEADVNAVADAAAYKVKKEAEAAAAASVDTANAERDTRIAVTEAVKAEAAAQAEAIAAVGTAEASATKAKGEALDASQTYLVEKLIEKLPEIVRAAAEPMSAISQMTVISGGGDDSGASSIVGNLPHTLATTTELVKNITGIDIAQLVTGRETGRAIGEAIVGSAPAAASAPALAEPGRAAEPEPETELFEVAGAAQ